VKIHAAVFRWVAFVEVTSFIALVTARFAGQDSPKTQPLPTVQQVMDRYVNALGGRDAIFKHKAMTVREKLEIPDKGLSLDRVVYFKDGKSHEELTLPDGGHYQSGYDGAIAWEMHPSTGPAIIRGNEAKSKARDADMYYPAHTLDYFTSMEVADIAEFEGRACYHLKGTNNWGKVNEHFYEIATGLLAGYRFNSAWRGGAGDERVVFSDYKDFGGWMMPTRIDHKEPQRTLSEVIKSVTFDDVSDSIFKLPGAVETLVKKEN
jgi:hypothetical protein